MPKSLPPETDPFSQMFDRRDLILVTGKGGTGKSTLVAALAELAARRRGSAVAVEMSVHPHLPELLGPSTQVQTVCVDLEQAVPAAMGRLLRLPALVTRVFNNRFIRLFIRTSPAVREMILLDELHHLVEVNSRRRTPVIVDLPASGHALSFLDTPRAVNRMLRVGPLAQVAARVEALILDSSRCELVIVALPEELPINETIELVRRATEIGLASRTVIVNQVPSPSVDPEDRPLLDLLHREGDAQIGHFASIARSGLDGLDQARAQIERLRSALDDAVIELPFHLDTDPRRRVAALIRALVP
ncbi:MAG: AAA family ATPase [Deltaproteobacteria bacterium]|nr:AAA family ATPase [Deltaproteobacteria bacterium]